MRKDATFNLQALSRVPTLPAGVTLRKIERSGCKIGVAVWPGAGASNSTKFSKS